MTCGSFENGTPVLVLSPKNMAGRAGLAIPCPNATFAAKSQNMIKTSGLFDISGEFKLFRTLEKLVADY
jgi:hypothetical protein